MISFPPLSPPVEIKFFTFSEDKVNKLILQSLFDNLKIPFYPISNPEEPFYDLDSQYKQVLLVDVQNLNPEKNCAFKKRMTQNLPIACWLLVDPDSSVSLNSDLVSVFDEIILKPLTESIFKMAFNFWSHSQPLFNSAALEKLKTYDDSSLIQKVLRSYIASLGQTRESFLSHQSLNDLSSLERLTHSIKSSSLIVGAQRIHNLCLWIEYKHGLKTPIGPSFMRECVNQFDESIAFYNKLSQQHLSE